MAADRPKSESGHEPPLTVAAHSTTTQSFPSESPIACAVMHNLLYEDLQLVSPACSGGW